jgi:hypothetical protein
MLCQQRQRGGLLHRNREVFIRTLAAYDIAALMDYGGLSLHEACEAVVMELACAGRQRRLDCRRS